jgi:IS30 family transposase
MAEELCAIFPLEQKPAPLKKKNILNLQALQGCEVKKQVILENCIFYKMAKGKALSEYQRGQIDAMHEQGLSNREIGKALGCAHTTIGRYLHDKLNYGVNKRCGRPPKVSERERRRIIKSASNTTKSGRQVKEELQLDVSSRTIRRVLNRSGVIQRTLMKRVPALTAAHRASRLAFAKDNMSSD